MQNFLDLLRRSLTPKRQRDEDHDSNKRQRIEGTQANSTPLGSTSHEPSMTTPPSSQPQFTTGLRQQATQPEIVPAPPLAANNAAVQCNGFAGTTRPVAKTQAAAPPQQHSTSFLTALSQASLAPNTTQRQTQGQQNPDSRVQGTTNTIAVNDSAPLSGRPASSAPASQLPQQLGHATARPARPWVVAPYQHMQHQQQFASFQQPQPQPAQGSHRAPSTSRQLHYDQTPPVANGYASQHPPVSQYRHAGRPTVPAVPSYPSSRPSRSPLSFHKVYNYSSAAWAQNRHTRPDLDLDAYRELVAQDSRSQEFRRATAEHALHRLQHETSYPMPPSLIAASTRTATASTSSLAAYQARAGHSLVPLGSPLSLPGSTSLSARFSNSPGSVAHTSSADLGLPDIDAQLEQAKKLEQQSEDKRQQVERLFSRLQTTLSLGTSAAASSAVAGPSSGLTLQEMLKIEQLSQQAKQHNEQVAQIRSNNELRLQDIRASASASQGAAAAQPAAKPAPSAKPKPQDDDDEIVILSSDDEEEPEVQPQEQEAEEEEVDHEEEEEYEEEGDEVDEEAEGVPGNTPRELAYWEQIMNDNRPDATQITEHSRSSLPLTLHSLRTLEDRTWLNDEIINLSMALLQEKDFDLSQNEEGRPTQRPKCHYFSTFFLNKLFKDKKAYNYKEVSRWTKSAKIQKYGQTCACVLECDLLLFPVHVGSTHWAMACADLLNRELLYWDSMTPGQTPVLQHLAQWIVDEARDKYGKGSAQAGQWADALEWPRTIVRGVPQQSNGCDCGVFAIMFAAFGGAGRDFTFSQEDMPVVRRRLAYDLAHLKWTIS